MTKSVRKSTAKLSFAMTDRTTTISGLFRVAEKGAKRLQSRVCIIKGAIPEGETEGVDSKFVTPYLLDDFHWRVFVTVCAMAGPDGETFSRKAKTENFPTLWDQFLPEGDAVNEKAIRVRSTLAKLLREMGFADSGQNRKRASDALEQLNAVTKTLHKGSRLMSGGRLISFAVDANSGEMSIAISPMAAACFLGGQHCRISTIDLREIKSPAAVIIHGMLSGRLRPKEKKPARYSIDTLVEMVYGESSDHSQATRRRSYIREAMAELDKLPSWTCVQSNGRGNTLVEIWRKGSDQAPRAFQKLAHSDKLTAAANGLNYHPDIGIIEHQFELDMGDGE